MLSSKPRTLKRNNRRLILDLVRRTGEITVADISRTISLSKTTVMKIIEYYLKKKMILSAGKGESTMEGGKKPQLFRFNERYGYAAAVHIFLDEIYGVVTDLQSNIVARAREPIQENEDLSSFIGKLEKLLTNLKDGARIEDKQITGIALGMHGIMDFGKGTLVASPHFPSWGTFVPIKEMLTARLGSKTPIYVDNQIRFQVWAEKELGAARGRRTVIVLEGGAGLVAGIIVKNRIKRGMHGLAGEVGHMIVNPRDEHICPCGGKGCFEVMVSVRRLIELAERSRIPHRESSLNLAPDGGALTPDAIFKAAAENDGAALEVLDDIIHWFAIGISNIILMYDPEMIILQGIYTRAGTYFLEELKREINTVSLTHITKNVEIVYSELGKDRGVLGGASFVINEFLKNERLYAN